MKLGQGIDWEVFDREFGKHYAAKVGRPATRTRLIVGLTYLQFMYDMSDEAVVERWVARTAWALLAKGSSFDPRKWAHPVHVNA